MPDKTLIVGLGEVGKALYGVLSPVHNVVCLDAAIGITEAQEGDYFRVAHICYPFDALFVDSVTELQSAYDIEYTVIHSTVPIGTSRLCMALHSPVMGRHPDIETALYVFKKFIGGEDASQVADHFRRAGIEVYITDLSESTELVKLYSTLYYGMCIEFTKEVKRSCTRYNTPFELWSLWNDAYNAGVHSDYVRPNLTPILGSIQGHCVLPNADLIDSQFAEWLKGLQK